MALDYTQSADLMKDPVFINRVKVACLKYADYIQNEGPGTAGHTSRIRWAQQTFSAPESTAQTVTPPVVMDGQVQQDGGAITDAALQTAVEGVVNKFM